MVSFMAGKHEVNGGDRLIGKIVCDRHDRTPSHLPPLPPLRTFPALRRLTRAGLYIHRLFSPSSNNCTSLSIRSPPSPSSSFHPRPPALRLQPWCGPLRAEACLRRPHAHHSPWVRHPVSCAHDCRQDHTHPQWRSPRSCASGRGIKAPKMSIRR